MNAETSVPRCECSYVLSAHSMFIRQLTRLCDTLSATHDMPISTKYSLGPSPQTPAKDLAQSTALGRI